MFRITANLAHRTLGDFCSQALFVSSIRDLFDEAKLYVHYTTEFAAWRDDIVGCIPNLYGIIRGQDAEVGVPLTLFNAAPTMQQPALEDLGARAADLMIAGNMFYEDMFGTIPFGKLRPPDLMAERATAALISLGLDPYKWIATVYWKEWGFLWHREPDRDRDIMDRTPYLAAIRYIIEKLGGQVIRLGHPTPEKEMPKIDGLIDLAAVSIDGKGCHWLQTYALAISRFLLTSPSGPQAYGRAFDVPTVTVDAMSYYGRQRDHDYYVTQEYRVKGESFRQLAAYDAGFMTPPFPRPPGTELIRNSAEQLIEAAHEMYESTSACVGWRDYARVPPRQPRPNAVTFPIPRQPLPRDVFIPPTRRPQRKRAM
jgi:putative glycosyltransferase (TIGR04372 family)